MKRIKIVKDPTTITINRGTVNKLKAMCKVGETYDRVINDMIRERKKR